MHYVIGDVHGCYNALIRLLDRICLTPEDTVFFVGDFIDRAPTHQEMLKTNQWVCEHITEDGQFQAVIGNHDLGAIETYQELTAFEGTPELEMVMWDMADTVKSLGNVVKELRQLPLYKEVHAGGYHNIITHSWICDASGDTVIREDGTIGGEYSVSGSVWDRCHSVSSQPPGCRVIHGHTITSSSYYEAEKRGSGNRIIRLGETNVNVDCGCFTGLSNGGNLAAFRLEDGAEFYAYDMNDAIAEYKELAQLTKEPYKLKDYQIFTVCNPLREAVFFQDGSEYTKYALDCLVREYGMDCSDQESFLRCCRRYVHLWRHKVRKNNAIDRRFVVWGE